MPLAAFSKCFGGAGYIKVGGGLVAEGNLSSARRAAASRGIATKTKLCNIWQLSDNKHV